MAGDTLDLLQKDNVFANFMRVGIARRGLCATIYTFEGMNFKDEFTVIALIFFVQPFYFD